MKKYKTNTFYIAAIFIISLFLSISSLYLTISTQKQESSYNYIEIESKVQKITDQDKLKSITTQAIKTSQNSQQSIVEAYQYYSISIFDISIMSLLALVTAHKNKKLLTSSSSVTNNP